MHQSPSIKAVPGYRSAMAFPTVVLPTPIGPLMTITFISGTCAESRIRLGLQGFMQEKDSASEEYTPSFRLEGVP